MKYAAVVIWFIGNALHAQERASLCGIFDDTSTTHIHKLPINSPQSDFGITACNNDFVFASSRDNRMMVRYFNSDGTNPYALYSFRKNDSASWSAVSFFSSGFPARTNEGPVTFSADGTTMISTANSGTPSDNGVQKLALYESHFINNKWSAPVLLPFCTAAGNFMQPCFSNNDSVLYFVSDRQGGSGGKDIWHVVRTGNGWSEPVNAGPFVNTGYDEVFPFYSVQGVLFFSSNRPGGKGGLDLYAASLKSATVEQLQGMINTERDDFGLWMNAEQNEGFFTSDREGDDNIYGITIDWPVTQHIDTIVKPQLCYTFFEEATVRTQDTANTGYRWTFDDGEQLQGYTVQKCFDSIGVYAIHLEIRDSSAGDMILSEVDYEFDVADPNYTEFVSPDSIHAGESFTIDAHEAGVDGYTVENIYYDFGNGFRSKGLRAEHVYHKPGTYYPQVYLSLRNKNTGAHENRCVVKPIVVK